jgi:hypothetical protein
VGKLHLVYLTATFKESTMPTTYFLFIDDVEICPIPTDYYALDQFNIFMKCVNSTPIEHNKIKQSLLPYSHLQWRLCYLANEPI